MHRSLTFYDQQELEMNEYHFSHKQPPPIILKAGFKTKQTPLKFAFCGFFVQQGRVAPSCLSFDLSTNL